MKTLKQHPMAIVFALLFLGFLAFSLFPRDRETAENPAETGAFAPGPVIGGDRDLPDIPFPSWGPPDEKTVEQWTQTPAGRYVSYAPGTRTVRGEHSFMYCARGEENRLLIYLPGGGMSVDAYTAAHPLSSEGQRFYTVSTDMDSLSGQPLFTSDGENPFARWTKMLLPCDTADCYIGAGDYMAETGALLRHRGYENFVRFLLTTCSLLPAEPETVVLMGSSAGGFGAALLAETVCEFFPDAEVAVVVDCACLSADWGTVARDVWQSPEEIRALMTTDDCVTDALVSLAENYGDRVRILYLAVVGDRTLAAYQNYLDTGKFAVDEDSLAHYGEVLRAAVRRLAEEVPGAGIYLYETSIVMSYSPHMLLPGDAWREVGATGMTVAEWIYKTALREEEPQSFGVEAFLME